MMTVSSECRIDVSIPVSLTERKKALESFVTIAVRQANKCMNLGEDLLFSVGCVENSEILRTHSEKRTLTWTRGRAAASTALKGLGFEDPPNVVCGDGGEPIWPEGICGSITHCHPWSVAVAMRSSGQISLGIDMESVDRISSLEITHIVCRGPECDWILQDDSLARLCMIFSAKEALYKSLYRWYRRYIDFTEAELSWYEDLSAFYAVLCMNESNEQKPLFISSQRRDDLIFSCSMCKIQ